MSFGHEVSHISPQHAKTYVKGNKNNMNDARAIIVLLLSEIVSCKTEPRWRIGCADVCEMRLFLAVGLSFFSKRSMPITERVLI